MVRKEGKLNSEFWYIIRVISDDLGFKRSKYNMWKYRGRIPFKLHHEFVEKANCLGLDLSFEDLQVKRFSDPKNRVKKISVSMSLDDDLIRFLRSTGKGWQTRANQYLRGMMTK